MEHTVSSLRSILTPAASSTSSTVKVISESNYYKFEDVDAGNRDLLRMLYHHHVEEFSRLPPRGVEILSEGTEVELDETEAKLEETEAEVISRGSWNPWSTPFFLPPHQEEPLCTEITEYVFPKAALSKQKQWR